MVGEPDVKRAGRKDSTQLVETACNGKVISQVKKHPRQNSMREVEEV